MVARIIPAAIVLAWLGMAGCLSGDSASRQRDRAITDAVQRAFENDTETNLTKVDVRTQDGVVYLDGELSQFEQKLRAEDLAGQVPGVRNVFNKIQVEP